MAVADFNETAGSNPSASIGTGPDWTKHKIRDIAFNGSYTITSGPADRRGRDGYTDIVQIAYFARRIVWLKNPGKSRGNWIETEIDAVGPTEFAFLVDLNNDGKALEILPQFTGAAAAPLSWYEAQNGKWVKHVVSPRSYGHGIGAGDVNGDKRNDIITPAGWLEAPGGRALTRQWTLHATGWSSPPPQPGMPAQRHPRRQCNQPAPNRLCVRPSTPSCT